MDSSKKERIEVILIRESGLGENECHWRGGGVLPKHKGRWYQEEATLLNAHTAQVSGSRDWQKKRETCRQSWSF